MIYQKLNSQSSELEDTWESLDALQVEYQDS